MAGIYAQQCAGEPGVLGATDKPQNHDHLMDVPVIGTAATANPNPTSTCPFKAVCSALWTGNRLGMRNRMRVLQMLLTIAALAFIRPQYHDFFQWTTLLVLVHSFVVSFVLFWDRRCSGTIVRSLLPLLDWRRLELQFTLVMAPLLYGLFYGLLFSHKGYADSVWCNWVSTVLTLLTGLAYGGESWLQLRTLYDGRLVDGN